MSSLFSGSESLRHCDTVAAEGDNLADELVLTVQGNNVVGTSNALPVNHDVRNRPAPCQRLKGILQVWPKRVFVQLDYVGSRGDGIFLEKETLGAFREGAISLGENDD